MGASNQGRKVQYYQVKLKIKGQDGYDPKFVQKDPDNNWEEIATFNTIRGLPVKIVHSTKNLSDHTMDNRIMKLYMEDDENPGVLMLVEFSYTHVMRSLVNRLANIKQFGLLQIRLFLSKNDDGDSFPQIAILHHDEIVPQMEKTMKVDPAWSKAAVAKKVAIIEKGGGRKERNYAELELSMESAMDKLINPLMQANPLVKQVAAPSQAPVPGPKKEGPEGESIPGVSVDDGTKKEEEEFDPNKDAGVDDLPF